MLTQFTVSLDLIIMTSELLRAVVNVYFPGPRDSLKMWGPLLSLGPQSYMMAPGEVIFDTDCFSHSTPK